jgi:hypothetical protein
MVINLASLPQETIEKYDLNELAQDGGLHRDSERNVRFATGRHTHQRIVTAQSGQGWIPPDDPHTRLMDTRYSSHIILVSSG